jgi:hypothetical protein
MLSFLHLVLDSRLCVRDRAVHPAGTRRPRLMRGTRCRAVVAYFGAASLAVLPLACGSKGSSTGASGTPGSDAGPGWQDASFVDPDGTTSGAAVMLTVLLGGAPEPGVVIVFQDATGAVLSSATTDASGAVRKIVPAGSQVTAVMGTALLPNLVTIQGVEPGDTLTVTDTSGSAASSGDEIVISTPAPVWDAAALVVEDFYVGACTGLVGDTLNLGPDCFGSGSQYPLLVQAFAQTLDQELAYSYQTGNTYVPGGRLEDGGPVPLAVTRPWTTSTIAQNVVLTNIPDGGPPPADFLYNSLYNEFAGGTPVMFVRSLRSDDGGPLSTAFTVHSGFPNYVQTGVYITGSHGHTFVEVTRSATPTSSQTATVDLSSVPVFTGASLDTTSAGSVARPSVSWSTLSPMSGAAGIVASIPWSDGESDAGLPTGSWTIVAPPSAASVRAPSLPPAQALWAPQPGANFEPVPTVGAFQGSLVPNYASFRGQWGRVSYSGKVPVLPANGTLFLSLYYDAG